MKLRNYNRSPNRSIITLYYNLIVYSITYVLHVRGHVVLSTVWGSVGDPFMISVATKTLVSRDQLDHRK